MISYSCDRCGATIENPPMEASSHPLMTLKEAQKGVAVLLPFRTTGYSFLVIHLCEPCLGELAVWRATSKRVDHTLVDDR